MCKADSGYSRAVRAPGGTVLAHCPDGGRKDVRNAVEAALKVQPGYDFRNTLQAVTLNTQSVTQNIKLNRVTRLVLMAGG